MTAPDVLARATANGVQLWRDGSQLRYHGAAGNVDPLLPDLQRFKLGLLGLLATEPPEPASHPLAVWDASAGVWKRRNSEAIFPTLATLGACMEVQRAKRVAKDIAATQNQRTQPRPQSEVSQCP
jgi:hypothetical protein